MNLAIIPARGGSKRIPGKNIRQFAGKPLIAYSIEVALESGLFDKIWVSTDSQEVADVAISYGAEVPFLRPHELSNDIIGTRPVTSHAIKYCIEHYQKPDYCCCIYATAPFLQAMYLKKGLTLLEQSANKSFSFAVTSFAFPIQRAISLHQNNVAPMFPEAINKRSQDLEEAFHDAGQFYWGKTDDYLTDKPIFSEHSVPVVLPRHLVQDIDTLEDWQRAELMYQAYVRGMQDE
ncbi:pseudaminic acid cytidylyltransferase [Aliiglaciecola lipolytica]|uniref:N-acylneuraminate cytidylyltransferase n=1 Tax=Aliiglaciecola lipolytica E3 TaxID=1127673 RepID=K6XU37_9ALTE|nr:pseudaminic acid cytidylyltransferase [Aliiglaciecola lipolytica]GAC15196.1 N-acylneuraminate cytidylyltransferase [Aliiglaciecola lipolytica E3]